jgi:hypothetical protein
MLNKEFIYEDWDWDNDVGIKLLGETTAFPKLPVNCAVVRLDHWGRIYRVEHHQSNLVPSLFLYEYFCDDQGRVVEKRSLDEHQNVTLIVRIKYENGGNRIEEQSWQPGEAEPKIWKK